jgi:hypothetical protein
MIERAREMLLEREIGRRAVPSSIALVISREAMAPRWWQKVGKVAGWCISLGVREATLFAPTCRSGIGGPGPPPATAAPGGEALMGLPV